MKSFDGFAKPHDLDRTVCYTWGNNDEGLFVGRALYSATRTNKQGTILASPTYHAFVCDGANMIDLGTLGSYPNSAARGINSSGDVVGWAYDDGSTAPGFLWTPHSRRRTHRPDAVPRNGGATAGAGP